jgi:hypothetical protein
MVFEKAAYWIAVGVLALFVTNHFAGRYENEARCLASQSLAAVEQVSGQATRFMAMTETMLGQGEAHFVRTQTMVACAQTRLASMQTVIASHEAALRGFRPSTPESRRCSNFGALSFVRGRM